MIFLLKSYYKYLLLFYIIIKIVSTEEGECLCKLEGKIDDCLCTVDAIDYINNNKLYPKLQSVLAKDYFRYFKINLNRGCPFWPDDGKCASKDCSVKPCNEDQIPEGLKSRSQVSLKENESKLINKYSKEAQELDFCDENHGGLGFVDKTISDENYEGFTRWQNYDDAQDNFCELDDESSKELQYVDLLLNPERYTGYKGPSAHRIWNSIYEENCFSLGSGYGPYTTSKNLQSMCLEKRVFYRAISGLHSSINLHLCSQYYFPPNGFISPGYWGANMQEFWRRFDRTGTGLHYLKNLYFLYLLELRALVKAAPLLEAEEFYTGNEEEDKNLKNGITDILKIASEFRYHFNESVMFASNDAQSIKLKEEFKQHFRNISRIMDCVGCSKCQLWGKLQTQGLGTTFKILFFGNSFHLDANEVKLKKFRLTRPEIVSLINGFGRLTNSIYQLERFRQLSKSSNIK